MSLNINELPVECLLYILNHVVISTFDDGISTLGALNKCKSCLVKDIKCKHLTLDEAIGIKILKLVCKLWYDCILAHFNFIDGPVSMPQFF